MRSTRIHARPGKLLDTRATFWPVSDTKFVVQAWASDVDPSEVLEPATEAGRSVLRLDVRGRGEWRRTHRARTRAFGPSSTIRLELDGRTYVQRSIAEAGGTEFFRLDDDASAQKVAESAAGEFWFLGRVSRADAGE